MCETNKEALEIIFACSAGIAFLVFALPFVLQAIKNSFFMEFVTAVTNAVYRLYKCWLQAWRDFFGER